VIATAGPGLMSFITVFVLAAFVGYEVVSKVPSILHTPLMSGSNAIHGIILVGTMIVLGQAHGPAQMTLGFLAVVLATLNVVGGFVVTDRMLHMFRAKPTDRKAAEAAAAATTAKAKDGDPGAGTTDGGGAAPGAAS
jgi:NAD(P) transhydrogenase subunit alpha